MLHFSSTPRNARTHNMHDITSDFDCLKLSALKKVSRLKEPIREVTIGPNSMMITVRNSCYENVENEPNNCIIKDIKSPKKLSNSKSSSRSNITFSKKKMLQEDDKQRKETVRQINLRRYKEMEQSEIELQEKMALEREKMTADRERKEKLKYDELAKLEAVEEQLAQQKEIKREREQQLSLQRRKEKFEREAEEHRKNKEKRMLIERMLPLQASFRTTYQDLGVISKSCKEKSIAVSAFAPYSAKLKELSKCMEGLVEHAKIGELTETDVSTAEVLVKHSEEILNVFKLEIERINAAHDAELARKEEEKRAQVQEQYVALRAEEKFQSQSGVIETEQKLNEHHQVEAPNYEQSIMAQVPDEQSQPISTEVAIPVASTKIESTPDGLLEFVDKESLQLYLNSQQLIENHKTVCSSLINSDTTRKLRFEFQKGVNVPVNAISGVSGEHLTDKFEKLHRLLAGKPPINANQHPQGIAFCKYTLAQKFVGQGEALVSSRPDLAFYHAAVAVALWSEYPDFGELLLAHFHKTCPYLVPIFLPQQQGQSEQDYYKSLGYLYSENGVVEKQDKFLKRMSGVVRLYAALTITKQRNHVTSPHPHGLRNAWRWLAAIMNIKPRSDVCASLIFDMLEVAGHDLWKTYRTQFQKLLTFLATQYFPIMQNSGATRAGPMSRLEEFLKKCLTQGSIPPPVGQLPPNFW